MASFPTVADGGPLFDFGTSGVPVAGLFELSNSARSPIGISDGMTLAPPFAWSAGGVYPGGDGGDFCSSTLLPGSNCTVSITYSGASTATGRVTLDATNAYLVSASGVLRGEATSRALVTVSESPGFFGCTDDCGPDVIETQPGRWRRSSSTCSIVALSQ